MDGQIGNQSLRKRREIETSKARGNSMSQWCLLEECVSERGRERAYTGRTHTHSQHKNTDALQTIIIPPLSSTDQIWPQQRTVR